MTEPAPAAELLAECKRVLKKAWREMCDTIAPRNSFTDTLDEIDALLTRLAESPAAAPGGARWRAPDGWKLVPIEPTIDMTHAAMKAARTHKVLPLLPRAYELYASEQVYAVMLAASPPPPEAPAPDRVTPEPNEALRDLYRRGQEIERDGIPEPAPAAPGLDWELSEDTKAALKSIDDNLRSAAARAHTFIVGAPAAPATPLPADAVEPLIERLRERRKLKYMGDCKCGQCQLVPLQDLDEIITALSSAPQADAPVELVGDHWPEAVSNGLTLPCGICGRVPNFDHHVSDDVWSSVVPAHLRLGVVCLPCFDRLAVDQGVDISTSISEVQFTGIGKTVILRPSRIVLYKPKRTPQADATGAEEALNDLWDDATNAVCQALQASRMCNCPDGECYAAKVRPSPIARAHARAVLAATGRAADAVDLAKLQSRERLAHRAAIDILGPAEAVGGLEYWRVRGTVARAILDSAEARALQLAPGTEGG